VDATRDGDDEIEGDLHKDDAENQSEVHDDSTKAGDTEEGIQEFHIDKSILCARSPFFQAAFNGPWRESITNSVTLPEQSPNSFAAYVSWLYKEVVTVELCAENDEEDSLNLLNLYALAEVIQDRDFADVIVDAMFRMKELLDDQWYEYTTARQIYSFTPPGSLLRALHVDMMLFGGHAATVNIRHKDLPQDFVHDMSERLSSKYLDTVPSDTGYTLPSLKLPLKACRYHYHRRTRGQCYKNNGLSPLIVVVKEAPRAQMAQVTTS